MKSASNRKRRGFTLIELSVAIMLGMATGAMVLTLFNQQLVFLRIFKDQNFLTDEAPIISNYVSRLIGKADRFRLHATVEDALSGTNPRLTASPVVVLNFKQPDGTLRASILSFATLPTGRGLYYYRVSEAGNLNAPLWAVTKAPTDVSFAVEQGVLRMRLTGPRSEQITYSGTMQQ